MSFTPPPTPPNTGDPANFVPRADAYFGWFPTFVSELNAAGFPDFPQRLINGTAAAPALAFQSQTNTGLYRIGTSILGLSVNGTERMRWTANGAQLGGLLTGTAVTQSATDTTAGRLLKVEDGGLLATSPNVVTDCNNATIGTIQRNNNGVNAPGGVATAWTLFTLGYDTNACVQFAIRLTSGEWFRRNKLSGTYGPWYRVFDQASILGTVSQSGGVPSGALAQGNANAAAPSGGYAERLVDGFQTVHHVVTTSTSADTTVTFTNAFLAGSTPAVSITPLGAGLRVELVSISPTAVVFSIRDITTGARVAAPAHLQISGRWSNMT